jgi:prepilin-type N-terminal cleavage/methylation domain-containing protein
LSAETIKSNESAPILPQANLICRASGAEPEKRDVPDERRKAEGDSTKMNMLRSKKGMTLVEVIVAFAMLSIVTVILVVGFRAMSSVTLRGDELSNADQELERMIAAEDTGSYTTEAAVQGLAFSTDQTNYLIPGTVRVYTEDGKTFRVFVPEE